MHRRRNSACSAMCYPTQASQALLERPLFCTLAKGMEIIVDQSRQQLHGICTTLAEAEVPELDPLRPLYDLVLQRGVHMEKAAIGTADGLPL